MKNAIKVGLFAIVIAVSAAACNDDETVNTTAPEGEVKTAIDTNKAVTPETPEAGGEVKEAPKGE
jgi:hypothetical protein